MDKREQIELLKSYVAIVELYIDRFVKGDSIHGLFLRTEDDAEFKQKILEILDLLKECFGANNLYAANIFNSINSPTMSGGPSKKAVMETANIIKASITKLEREHIYSLENKTTNFTEELNDRKNATERPMADNIEIDKLSIWEILKKLNIFQAAKLLGVFISFVFVVFMSGYKAHDIINEYIDNIPGREINWEGVWNTSTPTLKNLKITFKSNNNELIGNYNYVGKDNNIIKGSMVGKTEKNSLNGKWFEIQGEKRIGGTIYLLMSDDNLLFTGIYTRDWEGDNSEYVWRGVKIE